MDPILWQSEFLVCPINFWCFFLLSLGAYWMAQNNFWIDGKIWQATLNPLQIVYSVKPWLFLSFLSFSKFLSNFPPKKTSLSIGMGISPTTNKILHFSAQKRHVFPHETCHFEEASPNVMRPRLWWHRHQEPRWSRRPLLSVWALEVVSRCLQDYIW